MSVACGSIKPRLGGCHVIGPVVGTAVGPLNPNCAT